MRRLPIVLVLILVLAACGGSKKGSVSPNVGTVSTAAEKTQIKSAYEKFFAGKTPLDQRVALLQNGAQFRPVIQAFAGNPLAKSASATVSSVKLQGANSARVVYTVKLAGTSLGPLTGTAVRRNGAWKVGSASLCKLVALGGTTPSACKS